MHSQLDTIKPEEMVKISHQLSARESILVCNAEHHVRWQQGVRLHHIFERRCDEISTSENPKHLAVDTADASWSYADLDAKANQIARYLRTQGLGAGDVIGLLFDKSVYSYLSMLAVLKIHAAYVPLDPVFPADRIAYIAEDANVKALLSLNEFQALATQSERPVYCLDDAESLIDQHANTRLRKDEVDAPVSELCYIIYTSGSTGRPKGVPIDQASICNFVQVAAETYGYRRDDRVYQGLTLAFDFSVEEIWVPLCVGATLVPNLTGSSLLGMELSDFLKENRISAMCCVPTLLQTIEDDIPSLRLLIVSGEACPQDLIARWYTEERTILNAYGPTETTVTATIARSRPDEPVTIGQPLPTYSVIILEPGSEKVLPFGEEGEIAVAGVGVTYGYLNREEQTKKAFIKDFLNIENNQSGLIYRTGDLGVINGDGNIEYRGRIDLQVKIRGYRIELTEIESVMLQIPGIAQAVVIAFEPQAGTKELAAYYTTKEGFESLCIDTLVGELRERLPPFMVPAYYQQLDTMPMLASDKADRKSLPEPQNQRMSSGSQVEYVAPRNDMESLLAEELASVLQIEAPSVTANLFQDLGASSLLLARFSSAIRKRLPEKSVAMKDFYTYQSIAELAACLDERVEEEITPEAPEESYRIPSRWEYYSCGALQGLTYLAFFLFGIWFLTKTVPWMLEKPNTLDLYLRFSVFFIISFFGWIALSVALKWIVIGRWKAEVIPIWSFHYYRFWLCQTIMTLNPIAMFKGYPLYTLYLRMMGAKIGKNVVVECKNMPVCTDLLSIGDNTFLQQKSHIASHTARSNFIYTGSITMGQNVRVGEASVIDLNTHLEDNVQVGHASHVREGHTLKANKNYHGNPIQETDTNFDTLEDNGLRVTDTRRVVYSTLQIASLLVGLGPLFLCGIYHFVDNFAIPDTAAFSFAWYSEILGYATIMFVAFFAMALFFNIVVSRALQRLLKTDRNYIMYGVHFFIFRMIRGMANSKGFNILFGDSIYITRYMGALGYTFKNLIETGSNFGLQHGQEAPKLCEVGSATMISDGLYIFNSVQTTNAFCIKNNTVAERNFIGNNIVYPVGHTVGENCLVGTKTMVPIDGEVQENTGLLGSPCFTIPRRTLEPVHQSNSSEEHPGVDQEGLRNKTKHNTVTLLTYLGFGFVLFCVAMVAIYSAYQTFLLIGSLAWVLFAVGFMVFGISALVIFERAAFRFGRMVPHHVSIYDSYYWTVERTWKHSAEPLAKLWVGTPFRAIINRALGIRQGKMVYDEGFAVPEKTMVEIGDYCNFNQETVMQPHSLEDGVYKSDYIKLGNEVTLGPHAFVHFGVTIGDRTYVEPDAFVMKGTTIEERALWRGNPANQVVTQKVPEASSALLDNQVSPQKETVNAEPEPLGLVASESPS